jgi:DNA-binding NtrC family response regulator
MDRRAEIMILDDEPIVGDRLRPALEKCGYRVESYTNSREALDRLSAKQFDVLVTDLKMKGPTGIDVLRFVKDQSPVTRVIVITGYATAEQAKESIRSGALDFIAKPFRISQMVELIGRALGEPRP